MSEEKDTTGQKHKSIDPAALEVIDIAEKEGISTVFSRVDKMKACPIGHSGACCSNCFMGPCRLVGKDAEEMTGICGATLSTIAARNFTRAIAAGTAAHSDHARDLVNTLLGVGTGEIGDYAIRDEGKLRRIARDLEIKEDGMTVEEVARDVATKMLANFGQQDRDAELTYVPNAPEKRKEIWSKEGVTPRAIDREVVEMMHRTTMGVDQMAESILNQGVRTALADGWGGAMMATDISDILFGTPNPLLSNVNLGVLKEDEVNIVVHGHEPLLSEMIAIASKDPEMIEYAKTKGAKGVNLTGICCTANEVLMRHGIPPAGNFLHQELAIITGAVDAMVVDVQCVFQALGTLAEKYHTKLITTSKKGKQPGAIHIQFDEVVAMEIAKQIIRTAADNYPNRKKVRIPHYSSDMVAGFSHEYIKYMLGGKYKPSFRPLNDAIIDGRILGAVGIAGCNNPRTTQDSSHEYIIKELIKNDVLVVQTGCSATAGAKYGYLTPEAMDMAGEGLRSICEAVGIPPVIHLGSCVDNSRILTILTEVCAEGGLGDDLSDLPAVGIAPEWMSEKALAIGTYFAASGLYVIFGVGSPVSASQKVTDIMSEGWEKIYGGKFEFITDPEEIVQKTLEHIKAKRKALGIDVKKERVLMDMEDRRKLSV